ncbi:uncharacterized [Tachysurus ichikawai]
MRTETQVRFLRAHGAGRDVKLESWKSLEVHYSTWQDALECSRRPRAASWERSAIVQHRVLDWLVVVSWRKWDMLDQDAVGEPDGSGSVKTLRQGVITSFASFTSSYTITNPPHLLAVTPSVKPRASRHITPLSLSSRESGVRAWDGIICLQCFTAVVPKLRNSSAACFSFSTPTSFIICDLRRRLAEHFLQVVLLRHKRLAKTPGLFVGICIQTTFYFQSSEPNIPRA